jgi:hypothetical protein
MVLLHLPRPHAPRTPSAARRAGGMDRQAGTRAGGLRGRDTHDNDAVAFSQVRKVVAKLAPLEVPLPRAHQVPVHVHGLPTRAPAARAGPPALGTLHEGGWASVRAHVTISSVTAERTGSGRLMDDTTPLVPPAPPLTLPLSAPPFTLVAGLLGLENGQKKSIRSGRSGAHPGPCATPCAKRYRAAHTLFRFQHGTRGRRWWRERRGGV